MQNILKTTQPASFERLAAAAAFFSHDAAGVITLKKNTAAPFTSLAQTAFSLHDAAGVITFKKTTPAPFATLAQPAFYVHDAGIGRQAFFPVISLARLFHA
jgi:hypothetical protein